MSILGSISNIGDKLGTAITNMIPAAKINYSAPQTPQTPQTPPEAQYHVPGRDLTLSDSDLAVLKPTLYAEISNRNPTKKDLEARVIFNTALNRMKAHIDRGTKKSLSDVLSEPNQYQGFNSPQFHAYQNPADEPSKAKRQQVDSIVQNFLNEMESGDFPDVTDGAYYYIHHPTGEIEYDNKRPLFQSNFGKIKS